jgi:hypothetical protein
VKRSFNLNKYVVESQLQRIWEQETEGHGSPRVTLAVSGKTVNITITGDFDETSLKQTLLMALHKIDQAYEIE